MSFLTHPLFVLVVLAVSIVLIVEGLRFLKRHLLVKKASALFKQLREWRPRQQVPTGDLGFRHFRHTDQQLDQLLGLNLDLLARHNLTVDVIRLVYEEQQGQFVEICSKIIRSGDDQMENLLVVLKNYWEEAGGSPFQGLTWGQNQWDKWRKEGLSNRVKNVECEVKKLTEIHGFYRKDNQPFLCVEDLDSLARTLRGVADQVERLKQPVFVAGVAMQSVDSENKDDGVEKEVAEQPTILRGNGSPYITEEQLDALKGPTLAKL
jgi:hypothetical protein